MSDAWQASPDTSEVLDCRANEEQRIRYIPLRAKEASLFPDSDLLNSESPQADLQVPLRKPPLSVTAYIPEPLIDSEEAAAIIKVHPKTLQRLARQKLIKGVQIGTHWRFRASDIEAWYQQKLSG